MHRWLAAAMIALMAWPGSVRAEEAPAEAELGDVVVTATRVDTLTKDTPYYLDILGDDVLRLERAARSVPEALDEQTAVLVQKTGHGHGSPYIRGFTSFRNLMMIDGVRLNNSVFRSGPNQYWNTVDAYSLSRMEVVRGPFSVLYGSDAVGGTVNVLTRGAQDMRPGSRWDRRVYGRYSDAENSIIGRVESMGLLTDELALTLGYTAKDFGDLHGGRDVGTQDRTGYDEQDWDAKLECFLGDNARLTLLHQGVGQDDAWRTHKTIYGIDWEGYLVLDVSIDEIADRLRRRGVWTYEDLQERDRAIIGIAVDVIGKAIWDAAKKACKGT